MTRTPTPLSSEPPADGAQREHGGQGGSAQWEAFIDTVTVWLPYATLSVAMALAMFGEKDTADRAFTMAIGIAATAWTWFTFTRNGPPTRQSQMPLRIYFVGFVVLATILMAHDPVFLIYGLTGFLHAALLKPWWTVIVGLLATSLIVHSTIVYPRGGSIEWAIYLGVVTIQTVAVAFGLHAGHRVMEVADERHRMAERLEATMEENAGLHEQLIVQAREAGVFDERQRLARDIHDTIAQGLAGIITQLEAVDQHWGEEVEMHLHLARASELARASLADARRTVRAIRPAPLDGPRLPEAIEGVAARWSEVTDTPVSVTITGDIRPLDPDAEVALLRIGQEALANVERHAHATAVSLTLTYMDRLVSLDVLDNGVGFDPPTSPLVDAFGLTSMEQRVENLGGEFHIESTPGGGTAVSVHIPTTPQDGAHG